MKANTIVSTATLAASLLAYWYAKKNKKDTVPYILIGGYLGAVIGENIAERSKENITYGGSAT